MNIALKVVPSQITLNRFEQEKFGPYSYVFLFWDLIDSPVKKNLFTHFLFLFHSDLQKR